MAKCSGRDLYRPGGPGSALANALTPMDTVFFCLVEDFVPSVGVEPVLQRQLTLPHVTGDEILNRRGLVTDGIVGTGHEQDREDPPGYAIRSPEATDCGIP